MVRKSSWAVIWANHQAILVYINARLDEQVARLAQTLGVFRDAEKRTREAITKAQPDQAVRAAPENTGST